MTCYHPLVAYQHRFRRTANGKHLIDFKGGSYREWEEITLPCGKCIGCRLERSRQWAVRCVHEALLYDRNCFITLTFNDANLDANGSLVKRDFVLFMKRLRKEFGAGIRFFHCGEYGSKLQRPHHHAILFNFDFDDKVLWSFNNGYPLYRSASLERLWPFGFSTIGNCTFETAAYVARYVVKKVNGDMAAEHYNGLEPEYVSMSRMPGIGHDWLLKNPEIYNYDEVVIRNGIKCRPPHYYDKVFGELAPDFMENLKEKRKVKAIEQAEKNRIPGRLDIKEQYKLLQAEKLVRHYEIND